MSPCSMVAKQHYIKTKGTVCVLKHVVPYGRKWAKNYKRNTGVTM